MAAMVGRFLLNVVYRVNLVLENPGISEYHFPGLESHGKQQRSWKVMENKHNVVDCMEFLQLYVRPSVCLSLCSLWAPNSKTKRRGKAKIGVNGPWGTGVIGVLISSSDVQRLWL